MSEVIEIKLVDESPQGDPVDARPSSPPASKPEPTKPEPKEKPSKPGKEAPTPNRSGLPWESSADIRRGIAERQAARDEERRNWEQRQQTPGGELTEKAGKAIEKFTDALGEGGRRISRYTVGFVASAVSFFRGRDASGSGSGTNRRETASRKHTSRTVRRARIAARKSFRPVRRAAKRIRSAFRKHGAGIGRALGKTKAGRAALSVGKRVGGAVGRALPFLGGGGAATGAAGAAGAGAAGAAGAAAAGLTALLVPLAALIAVVAGVVIAFRLLTSFFDSQAKELEQYSGSIAGVRAEIEAQRITSKIDRAEKIGPQVAQANAAQGRLEEATYELWTSIYEILANAAPLVELVSDTATAGVRGINAIIQTIEVGVAAVSLGDVGKEVQEAQAANEKLVDAIKDIFEEQKEEGKRFVINAHNPFAPRHVQNANPNVPGGGRVL